MKNILVMVICLMTLLTFVSVGSAEKITPTDDVYVYGYGYQSYNGYVWRKDLGYDHTYLRTDGNGRRSYLMFDLNGKNTVSQASLIIKVLDCKNCRSDRELTIHYVTDYNKAQIDETTMKWTTQPCGISKTPLNYGNTYCSATLDSIVPDTQYKQYKLDITSAYNDVVTNFPNGQKYLTLVTSSKYTRGVDFISKEYSLVEDRPYIGTENDAEIPVPPPETNPLQITGLTYDWTDDTYWATTSDNKIIHLQNDMETVLKTCQKNVKFNDITTDGTYLYALSRGITRRRPSYIYQYSKECETVEKIKPVYRYKRKRYYSWQGTSYYNINFHRADGLGYNKDTDKLIITQESVLLSYSFSVSSNRFYYVDKSTGYAEPIFNLPHPPSYATAYCGNGIYFLTDSNNIYQIRKNTITGPGQNSYEILDELSLGTNRALGGAYNSNTNQYVYIERNYDNDLVYDEIKYWTPSVSCTTITSIPDPTPDPDPTPPPVNYDVDGDGYKTNIAPIDCDDSNANIHPNAQEILHNGIDEDCDGHDDLLGDSNDNGSVSLDELLVVMPKWKAGHYTDKQLIQIIQNYLM